MKIHNIPGVMKAYNQKKVHSTHKPESIGKKDEMSISNEAQVMSKIMQRVKETPDIREERVNELKQQIKQGTYSVSADNVAEKLLKGALFSKKA
ncbi:MAG: flagellar biosynthesis anti-sigma factor FlgM [Clostridia bacterium]|jgi:negative regulator of flagellin synthesis FlgM|nr:flagellar biosynthesis anti-sigma factor FlgM [Clostridia bacterium]